MPRNIVDFLHRPGVVVTDGATGTMLQTLGLPPGAAPEEWVLSEPDKIRALYRAYVDAGSDIFGVATSAVKQGEAYVLNGTKMFITKCSPLQEEECHLAMSSANRRTRLFLFPCPLGGPLYNSPFAERLVFKDPPGGKNGKVQRRLDA
jgi:methionine synthase I (cobalamin-dependent)